MQNKNQDSESTIRIEKIPLYHVISTRRIKLDYQNSDVSIDRWSELIELAKKYHLKTMGSIILTYHNEPLEQFYNKDCDLESCIQGTRTKRWTRIQTIRWFFSCDNHSYRQKRRYHTNPCKSY